MVRLRKVLDSRKQHYLVLRSPNYNVPPAWTPRLLVGFLKCKCLSPEPLEGLKRVQVQGAPQVVLTLPPSENLGSPAQQSEHTDKFGDGERGKSRPKKAQR